MVNDKDKITNLIINAVKNPEIPKTYANGFSCALGIGDVSVMLQRNGEPIEVLNLSYTVAKTLSIKLQDLISYLENKSKNTIMSTDEIEKIVKSDVND